jgi:HK97 family phage portal protein
MKLKDIVNRTRAGMNPAMTRLNLSETRGNPLENPSVSPTSPGAWAILSGDTPTPSGELVGHATALQVASIYTCIKILSEAIASLPFRVFERLENGRKEAVDNAIWYLLMVAPNPEQNAYSFKEALVAGLMTTGNGYVEIRRNPSGQPAALYILHPLLTTAKRDSAGKLYYSTRDGEQNGGSRRIETANIIHVKLYSLDGITGMSPITQARNMIGLDIAANKFGSRFFGNGSRPGGVMSTASDIDDVTRQEIKESFERGNGGENQGRTAFLYGDWKYNQLGISPEESQFLGTQNYTRSAICALYRIPPHMAGDLSRLSNANAEQAALDLVVNALTPITTQIENEVLVKLLPTTGRNANRFFVEADFRQRLKGDFKSTLEALSSARQWGYMSANEARKSLGMNPIGPEGDVYLAAVNMINAEKLLDPDYNGQPTGSTPAKSSKSASDKTDTEDETPDET